MSSSSRLTLRKRRAISPIIATVLIIAVTLIASVAIGGFVFGIFAQGQNSAQVAVTGTALIAALFPTGSTSTTLTSALHSHLDYLTRLHPDKNSATTARLSAP